MKSGLITAVWLLFLLPGVLTPLQAQADGDQQDAVVTVFISTPFNDSAAALEDIKARLRQTLESTFSEANGFVLVQETEPDVAAIEVTLDLPPESDALFVDLLPITPPPGFFPTPSIVPHQYTEFPLAAGPDDAAWSQITSKAVVALGAYIFGDCDTTINYLEQAQSAADNLEQNYFIGQQAQTQAYIAFYRASCALATKDYESAAADYERVLEIYEENDFDPTLYGMAARVNLAWTTYQLGDVETAFSLVDIVVDTQFDWMRFDALLMRSELHLQESNVDAALEDLDAADEVTPSDDVDVLLRSSYLRALAGDFKGAEAALTQVDKTMPGLPDTYYYRALVLREQDEPEQAMEMLQNYLDTAPDGYLAEAVRDLMAEIEGQG